MHAITGAMKKNGWKLIAARLTIHLIGESVLAAKSGPCGLNWQPNLIRGDQFWQKFCQLLGESDFGVTESP